MLRGWTDHELSGIRDVSIVGPYDVDADQPQLHRFMLRSYVGGIRVRLATSGRHSGRVSGSLALRDDTLDNAGNTIERELWLRPFVGGGFVHDDVLVDGSDVVMQVYYTVADPNCRVEVEAHAHQLSDISIEVKTMTKGGSALSNSYLQEKHNT